jgi:Zn-dependent protease with chaperone function
MAAAAFELLGATAVALSAGSVVAALALRRLSSVTAFRLAAMGTAVWAVVATTALVWVIAQGGLVAAYALARRPDALLEPPATVDWIVGSVGAFAIFLAAFAVCQGVGRGLLRVLRPVPLAWPTGLSPPPTPCRLLRYPSARPDAFTFTLFAPMRTGAARREEVILISDGLVGLLSADELEAVIAHELGHVRELDGRYLTFFRTFAQLVRWDPILALLARAFTRREELRADDDSVEMTHRPRALARALFKASRSAPSHPGALAGLLGPAGSRGRQQVAERIQRLIALAESGRFPEEPVD